MQRKSKSNGFETLVFERGDGVVKRWSEVMQPWRLTNPEWRRLAHPYAWYLEEGNLLARPAFGMLSMGRFAEHLLWRARRECSGGRAEVKAARLFAAVQRKMSQLRYRTDKSGRFQRKVERGYLASTLRGLVGLAKTAVDAFDAEAEARRTTSMRDALA